MKRIVLAATLALALLGGLLLAFFGGGAARGEEDRAAVRPAAAAEARDARKSAALAPAGAAPAEGLLAEDAAAPDRGGRVAHAAEVPAPAGPGFALRIVSAADEAPIAGALVFACVSEGEVDDTYYDLEKVDAWIEERGAHLVADERGRVRVPAGVSDDARTLVLARHGGLWGQEIFKAPPPGAEDEAPPMLKLAADVDVTALTVDEGGRPVVGVGVSLDWSQHGRHYPKWGLETGKDGLARFRHVQVHRERDPDIAHWAVNVEVLTQAGIIRDVDLASPPAEPLRFVLPATGTVVVRVLDVDGRPWTRAADVVLEAIRAGEPRELSPFGSEMRTTREAEAKDGIARFPFVGLGFELALYATRQESFQRTRAYAPGPLRAGEEVRCDLAFGTEHPVIELRALAAGGAPLAGKTIYARVEMTSQFMHSDYAMEPVAGSDGRIRLDLDAAFTEKDQRSLHLALGASDAPEASAVLDLSRKLEPGLHDLGDVYLVPPGVFVAGRVVDAAGAAVGKAELLLRRYKPENDHWEHIWEFSQEAREDGTFDVRTRFEGTRFQIGARAKGLRCLPQEFAPGDASVVLALAGAGSLVGSVRLDDGVPTEKIKVAARPQERTREEQFFDWDDGRADIEEDGAFALRDLFPGLYDVTIELEGAAGPLHEVDGVVVAGGETADPRLQGVDLRGRLHARHFTLVPPEGRSLGHGNYRYGAAGAEELQQWGWFNESEFDLVSVERAIDVDITVPGFELVRLRGVAEDQTVKLSSGLAVRLLVRGDAELPEPPFYVKPTLVPAEGAPINIDWGAPALDASREAVVRAVEPGRMKVQWVVERRAPHSATATIVDATPEQTLEVLPGVADQVFEVTLSREALDRILAALL